MDTFLLSKVGGSKNNPVELKLLHTFKRMRHFQPFEAIGQAIKDSTFLELTDNDTCVRRREPLPESIKDQADENTVRIFEDRAMPRSIYAKGFGDEEPRTQFDIEAFFAPYGPTNAIRLRRTDNKLFKGSVFVEFADENLQKKFLALEPPPKYKGRELKIMSKKTYCEQKVEDIKAGRIQPNRNRGPAGSARPHRDNKRKREDDYNRDWKQRREEDRRNGYRDNRRSKRGGRPSRQDTDER